MKLNTFSILCVQRQPQICTCIIVSTFCGAILLSIELAPFLEDGLPHHSIENSRTFQDLALKFPELSRAKPIFRDFPNFQGVEILPTKCRTFQEAWEPWLSLLLSCVVWCRSASRCIFTRPLRHICPARHSRHSSCPCCYTGSVTTKLRQFHPVYNLAVEYS